MKRILIAVGIILLLSAAQAADRTGPRVYISVDMEGIWGVVHGNQTSSDSPEYGPARKWMAEDVNAAIAGYFNVPVVMLTGDTETCAQAELPTLIYLAKRTNPRTVEFSSGDYLKGFKLLRALIGLAGIS